MRDLGTPPLGRLGPARLALAGVALLHAVTPLVLLGAHWHLGIDETVYLSQLNAFVPAGGFSAPRARGTTLIAAPVTLVTSSLAAVRVWLALLSGVGLYLGFGAWLRLRDGLVVPLAALLFSSIWTVMFYGFAAMPNQWVAFAALACCGHTVGYLTRGAAGTWGARLQLGGAGLALAAVALFRPSDAAFAGAGLAVACVLVPAAPRRKVIAVVVLAVGAALGGLQWVVEARRYGGLMARVHAAQAENGGGAGLHFTGGVHAQLLGGRLVCTPGCGVTTDVLHQAWWIVLGLLVVAGLVSATHRRTLRLELAPVVVALAMAAQYLLTLTLTAPRFLLPSYALLALTAAGGVRWVVSTVRPGRVRVVVAALLVALFVAHTVVQVSVVTDVLVPSGRRSDAGLQHAADDLRSLGLRTPCLLLGHTEYNQRLTYDLACANRPTDAAGVRAAVASGTAVAWLSPKKPSTSYGKGWTEVSVFELTSGRRQPAWFHLGD